MQVTFFQRKPIPNFHFSVEIIFGDIKRALPEYVEHKTVISKYYSQGLFKRLYNCYEVFRNKGSINHVAGDINYVGMVLPPSKTVHTILDCVFLEQSTGIKRSILKYFWLTMPVKRSRFVTTISHQIQHEIVKHSRCNPEKIHVIPIALSPVFTSGNKKPFNKEKPLFLMVGSAPNKNIPAMLNALKGLSCKVHIIGKYVKEFETIMKNYGMEYEFKIGLNQHQMLEEYRQADILMFVSTYEGFGMPVIEAQAVGLPVVTSNVSSMPEVSGGAAMLVNPYDVTEIRSGVDKLIQDDDYRNAIVKKGFENVKRFDIHTITQAYIDLYKRI